MCRSQWGTWILTKTAVGCAIIDRRWSTLAWGGLTMSLTLWIVLVMAGTTGQAPLESKQVVDFNKSPSPINGRWVGKDIAPEKTSPPLTVLTSTVGSTTSDLEKLPPPLTTECIDAAKKLPLRSKFTLTHIINPFATTDLHFNFTLRAISVAVQYARAHNISVQVLGITFDNEIVPLPKEVGLNVPQRRTACDPRLGVQCCCRLFPCAC